MSIHPSSSDSHDAASDFALDIQQRDLAGVTRDYASRIRAGDLGALPAILAIAALSILFGASRSSTFLTVTNFANLLQQAAPVTVIAMAVSFVLLLGEIDLSAGYTAGVTAAVLALRLKNDWGLPATVVLCAVVALALGSFTGYLVAKVGIPSFVVTLANFLSFQGILLLMTKDGGTIQVENKTIVALENSNMSVAVSWSVAVIGTAAYALWLLRRQRASAGTLPLGLVIIKVLGVAALAATFTGFLSKNRALPAAKKKLIGVPYAVPAVLVIVLILTFILNRTRYGRHLYAVGGNAEAARRAGINVPFIRASAFAICGLIAGIGGAFLASRLSSVDPQTGGNDTLLLAVGAAVIGGTSLFGGKGRMVNAILGGMVLALIPNGLGLLGKSGIFGREVDFGSSGIKFIVSGLVLLLAASVDALSRARTSH
jgi:D-xylose transport system permease protein